MVLVGAVVGLAADDVAVGFAVADVGVGFFGPFGLPGAAAAKGADAIAAVASVAAAIFQFTGVLLGHKFVLRCPPWGLFTADDISPPGTPQTISVRTKVPIYWEYRRSVGNPSYLP